jgi:thiol:disulfide interchange protein DsbD
MSLGVMGFWLVLGIAIATISGFSQVNQLFQYPLFTLGMGIVICLLAIGMCGLFSVRLPNSVYNVTPKHDTFTGSVLFGVMTAVLSTPCTGPFMGAAAAWSATQTAIVTVAVFAAIGVGMALPYLILSAFPGLARKMPSAGPVSVLVKQFLGLCLLAAGAYFLGVGLNGLFTVPPDEPGLWHWWLVCGILAVAGLWLAVRSLQLGKRKPAAIVWALLGLVMLVGSLVMGQSLTSSGPIDWVMYTPDRMSEAQSQGKAVLVDFTAQWCLNCQVLEHQVLHSDAVVTLIREKNLVPMKVDLTSANPDGSALLQKAGRVTIPLLVIYDTQGKVLFLSDSYTPSQVTDVLNLLP